MHRGSSPRHLNLEQGFPVKEKTAHLDSNARWWYTQKKPKSTTKQEKEQVARTELVMIPDVSHTLVMEKPVAFNALVDRFLRG